MIKVQVVDTTGMVIDECAGEVDGCSVLPANAGVTIGINFSRPLDLAPGQRVVMFAEQIELASSRVVEAEQIEQAWSTVVEGAAKPTPKREKADNE